MSTYKISVHFINEWIETTGGSVESIKRRVKRQIEQGELNFEVPNKVTVGVKRIR